MYINIEDQKIRVEDIISNLIPDFILEENPLFLEFLKSYFISRESFGSDIDIIRNLLEYQKIEKLFFLVEETTLSDDIEFFDTTITVESTKGWPQRYGLLQIDGEIIGYEYKTDTQFINCYRGFSGATQLGKYNSSDSYIFTQTEAVEHTAESKVTNVGILFLKEFLFYLKSKYMPGFENIDFYEGIDSNLILPRIKDFYSSKGTFNSFKILFKLLYGKESEIILPSEKTLSPSESQYVNISNLIVELKSGDIEKIKGSPLFQDQNISEGINAATASVYDFNLIKSESLPTRSYTGIATQSSNIIRVTAGNHGLSTGDSVYVQFPSNGSTSRVFPEASVINDSQFLLYATDSLNVLDQEVNIETLSTPKKDFYKLKINSVNGNFIFSGKTNLISDVKVGDVEIFVDSTLGFLDSGVIEIEGDIISYTSKSVSSFKGCSNIDVSHDSGSDVTSNREIYSYEDGDSSKKITMRLVDTTTNRLSNKKIISKNNSKLTVKDFGYSQNSRNIDSFILNKKIDVKVSSIDASSGTFIFETPHPFLNNDIVDVKYFNAVNKYGIRDRIVPGLESVLVKVLTVFSIQVSGIVPSSIEESDIVISKINELGKSLSNKFLGFTNQSANVQRIFVDDDVENYYIAASSIPSSNFDLNLKNNSYLKTFTYNSISNTGQIGFGTDSLVFNNQNHTFKSGEKVRLLMNGTESININQSLYIKKINDNTIKFGLSPSSVEGNNFVNLSDYIITIGEGDIAVSLIKDEYYNKEIKDQENLRKIKTNINEGVEYDFSKKPVIPFGILSNGVDLYPPFADDEINYGRIQNVSVIDGGKDFDVINPPVGIFTNTSVGIGASIKLHVEGEIKEILVSNSGRNVKNTISIKITGGNNEDVKLSPILKDDYNFKIFKSGEESVNLINNTITFASSHTFITGEKVKYNVIGTASSIGLEGGGNLINNSNYFVIKESDTVIKLARTEKNALSGDAIGLGVTFGSGDSQFTSVNPTKILERIDVDNPGKFIFKIISFDKNISEYPTSNNYDYILKGINIDHNYIFYRNHGFENGELFKYESTSTTIGGLVNNNYYHILKIDNNKFRLCFAGSDINSISTFNYDKQQYVILTDIPLPNNSLRHSFRTPEISFTVTDDYSDVTPIIVPVVRGKITNAVLNSNGTGYGSQTLNLIKTPNIEIEKGSDARVELIINNGRVSSVFVINSGSGYSSLPDLIVNPGTSDGIGAKLLPVISEGKLIDVIIINGGFNYNNTANVSVNVSGAGENFNIELQKWRVNSIFKHISPDGDLIGNVNDYYLIPGKSESLQIVSSYPGKDLRSKFGDSINLTDAEISKTNVSYPHATILGWAFDGNPIYGQFGFSEPNSFSATKRIKSGYRSLDFLVQQNRESSGLRPNLSNYPNGYFIEDYYYDDSFGDLDEYNGRYCITPDFPNGTYAYFTTIDSEGLPAFPYGIYGLKDRYDTFNEDFIKSKQSYLKTIIDRLITCTSPYNLDKKGFDYPFLPSINTKQSALAIIDQKKSIVDSINVLNSGDNYSVGDKIKVLNTESFGSDAIAEVSSLSGVSISTITTTKNERNGVYFEINPNNIKVINNEPHEFSNRDNIRVVVSGITTNDFSFLNGNYPIRVIESTSVLIDDVTNTGINTYIKLTDTIDSLNVNIDDYIKIDSEKMKVLRIDEELNQLKVKRSVDGTSIDSHENFSTVEILPSTFTFSTGIVTTSYTDKYNKVYFNTSQVGIGTTSNTIIDYVGVQTQISVNPKAIYIPNHGFKNNQKVTYNFVGFGLTVSPTKDLINDSYTLDNGSNLYTINLGKNFIGLSSVPIKVGAAYTDQNLDLGLYFENGNFDNDDQSLTFNIPVIGDVFELTTTIDTEKPHGLLVDDTIELSIGDSFTEEYQLLYDGTYDYLKFPAKRFYSGISSANNTLTFPSHGFRTGDRVIYSSESSSNLGPDFYNGQILYVKTYSDNIISFTSTENDIRSNNILNITETDDATKYYKIEQINPNIRAIKGSKIKLIGISTIPVDINYYSGDSTTSNYLDTSSFIFEPDSVTIDTNKIPSEVSILARRNGQIINDYFDKNTSISVINSIYNNSYKVTGVSSATQFNIELYDNPNNLIYDSTNSSPKYTTTSIHAKGPINKVKITNSGSSFLYPVGISSIMSETGIGASFGYTLLKDDGDEDNIDLINSVYNFSSDSTYKFNLDIPSIVSVKFNNKLVGIAVTDSGKNYILPPKVEVFGYPEITTQAELNGNSVNSVNLITRDNGVLDNDLIVYADFHTNGVEIFNVSVESDNQTVNLFLEEPNNGFVDFPFAVNDKIYVEGINAVGTGVSGFNSKDHNFAPFTITGINTIQGNSKITYNISEVAGYGSSTGDYDSLTSFGRAIKLEDLVKFDAILGISNYSAGESVFTSSGYSAIIDEDGWNSENKVLSLKNQTGILNIGDVLFGSISGARSIVTQVVNQKSLLIRDSSTNSILELDSSFSQLNLDTQVISDNFYYQPFAYDISSEVSLDEWKSTVENLNHICGFEKFASFIILDDVQSQVKSNEGEVSSNLIIESDPINLEKVYNFDYVVENNIDAGEFSFSNEINFDSKQLTDSIISISNRAIILDDISNQFTGEYDADDGGNFVGLTSFRLTTSENGVNNVPLFVKKFDSSETDIVNTSTDMIYIPNHNFVDGEVVSYSGVGEERISIASTTGVIGGISTDKLPSQVAVSFIDVSHIRLAGFSTDAISRNYFDITNVGIGTQTFKSLNQNTRCMISIDGIIQSPLSFSDINVGLAESVGIGSTTIKLVGITSIFTNSLIQIEDEIVKVDSVGFGSTNVVTVDRGFMGSIAAAHTVGASMTIREGEYIVRDDVIYFASAPQSGLSSTFTSENTGINSSFMRMKFHGRVFNRVGFNENYVFDDISYQFDGSKTNFELTSNNNSVENIFSSAVGLLTGTDVSSGVMLINNVFQIPRTDYDLVQNVGVGASIEFKGTNNETIPSGGSILSYEIERGHGYQELTKAHASIGLGQVVAGEIIGITLEERGSGYREDQLITINDANPGTGATIYALVGTGTYSGNTVNISNFIYDKNTGLSTVTVSSSHGLTTSQIPDVILSGIAFTCDSVHSGVTTTIFPDGTQPSQFKVTKIIDSTNFEIQVGTSTIGHTYDSGGTVIPGSNVGFITGFRIDNGGSNYSTINAYPIPEIPFPNSYSNLSLIGGNGSDAKGDLVIAGIAGSTFEFELIDIGIGYDINDTLSISGIPTSPYVNPGTHVGFALTVLNVSRDKFSGYNFGELILFDDISILANDFRKRFPLTRTLNGEKSFVSLDVDQNRGFNLQNNLLIFINDILQVPGEAFTFEGGTQVTFTEPPRKNSIISILFFKGSNQDIIESNILETVKIGDNLTILEEPNKNLDDQFSRRVYNIPGSNTTTTNVYSNVGLGTNDAIRRPVDWSKQKNDIFINGEKIFKTRPELVTKLNPSCNIIKDITDSSTEIFVDTIKLFEIDGIIETDQDFVIRDSKFVHPEQAKVSINISNSTVSSVSIDDGGSGYYNPPDVSIFSKVPQIKVPGSFWTSSNPAIYDDGIKTYDSNFGIPPFPFVLTDDTILPEYHTIVISSGNTVIVNDGVTLSPVGVKFTSETFNDVAFVAEDKSYVLVGTSGIIGYNTTNSLDFIIGQSNGSFVEDINSIDYSNYNEPIFLISGDGVLGYSTNKSGPWNKVTEVQPVTAGSISQNTTFDPADKISISDINYNDVKYFSNIDKAIAVGSSIAITGIAGTFGLDWNNANINSNVGGPEGKTLNSIIYYDRQDADQGGIVKSAGYIIVGDDNYIFKSHNGIKWNTDGTGGLSFIIPNSSLPGNALNKNYNDIATNNDSIVVVGEDGLIIRATQLKSHLDTWSYVGITTTEDFISVENISDSYVAITTTGRSYVSLTGESWVENEGEFNKQYRSVKKIEVDTVDNRLISVGSTTSEAFIAISDNTELNATFTSFIDSTTGIVTGITINNSGFGYTSGNIPIIMIAPPITKYEQIENSRVHGDYGNVVAISTAIGINTDHALKFELEIDPVLNSPLYDNFSSTQSGIKTGYYFAIEGSIFPNISESFGSLAYPGLTTITESNNVNKIYQASEVVEPSGGVGIVTVTADINITESGVGALHNEFTEDGTRISGISTLYHYSAKYSWGRFYNFIRSNPQSFNIIKNTEFAGLSSHPSIHRVSDINQNY